MKDDLVSDEVLDKVEQISKKYGYPKISIYCRQRLDDIEEVLHESWITTNANIANGTNTGIQLDLENQDKPWKLTYDAHENPYKEPFFDGVEKIDIASLLTFVANKTNLCYTYKT